MPARFHRLIQSTTSIRLYFLGAAAAFLILPGCKSDLPVRVDSVDVRLVAHDTTWGASYLIQKKDETVIEVPTAREVHVPVGTEVRLMLSSRDFISDFRLPELGLRDFAAPGLPSEFKFHAERPGRYLVRGDELCGLPHGDKTRGWLIVEDAAAFQTWIQKRIREVN